MTEPETPTTEMIPKLNESPLFNLSTDSTLPLPLTYDLKLTLTEEVYAELMRGNAENVIKLVKSITPPLAKKIYGSWKDVKKKKNKVAIVGFADSRDQAPFNDDSFEIWGLNSLFEMIPRYDRWFEIHDRRMYNMDTDKSVGLGLTRDGRPYVEGLAKLNGPVYMVADYPDIPNCVRYPLEEMITEFDPQKRRMEWKEPFKCSAELDWNGYFTNSISYMIALAIYEKYEDIGIYGVDMATGGLDTPNGEYAHQRPSCEYYMGIAVGRGIRLTVPSTADLLKTRFLYGPEVIPEMIWAAKLNKISKSMNDRMVQAQQNKAFAQKQEDQYIGALECTKELHKIWVSLNYPQKFYQAFDKILQCNPDLQKLI